MIEAILKKKNKWIRLENVKFLEKIYILYALKSYQKKCFNENCRVGIKITKDNSNPRFLIIKVL